MDNNQLLENVIGNGIVICHENQTDNPVIKSHCVFTKEPKHYISLNEYAPQLENVTLGKEYERGMSTNTAVVGKPNAVGAVIVTSVLVIIMLVVFWWIAKRYFNHAK